MPRRIEVELTSRRDDGTWTWRAAGAREPKGVLEGGLLPGSAKVGDVLRVEADFDIEGITILSVLPPKGARPEPERIELLARPQRDDQLVVSTLAPKRERPPRGDRRDRGDRGDRPPRGDRGDRGDRAPRGDRPDRSPRTDGPDRPPRTDRPERRDRRERPGEPAAAGDRTRGPRRERPPRPPRVEEPPRPKPKRLRPGRVHRKAVLEDLPPEQRAVAEQVLQGGIPAVRQAVERQNEEARAAGRPEVKAEPLVGLAEQLLPRLRSAEWRDRAEAALADVDELDLRDLRSVVVAADAAARDDESRELAARLREHLTRRVDEEQSRWLDDLTGALRDGRVVRALRLSSRPPKAGSLLPSEITGRLTEAANAALTADVTAERWGAVLDAVALSPVRRAVKPQSVPPEPSDELLTAVRKYADRVPAVAAAFGIAS